MRIGNLPERYTSKKLSFRSALLKKEEIKLIAHPKKHASTVLFFVRLTLGSHLPTVLHCTQRRIKTFLRTK
jgi:hypothetical protein